MIPQKNFLVVLLGLWWLFLWFFSGSASSCSKANCTFLWGVSSFCFETKKPEVGSPKPWAEVLCLRTDYSSSSQTILQVNQAQISKPSLNCIASYILSLDSSITLWGPWGRKQQNKMNKQKIPCQKWGGLVSHGSVTTSTKKKIFI